MEDKVFPISLPEQPLHLDSSDFKEKVESHPMEFYSLSSLLTETQVFTQEKEQLVIK